jgi:hypothetical protein
VTLWRGGIKKMKEKILSILLLLVVVTAFSGVASATSHQVLVTPAYDEQKLVSDAWNETIPGTPAIPAITHEQLVSDAYWIWHCDIYDYIEAVYEMVVVVDVPEQIINHPAVYETIVVVDQEAYDEEVLVSEAYDKYVGQKEFNNRNGAEGYGQAKINSGDATSYTITKVWDCYHYVYVVKLYKHVDAVYEIVHHEAITHEEEVLVSEAYDEIIPAVTHEEQRLVSEAEWLFLGHMEVQTGQEGYGDMIAQCGAAFPGWNMISHPHDEVAAVYETIIDVPEVPAVPEQIIEHPAVYETIHHEAVYMTVEDPVVPIVVPEVPEPVAVEPVAVEPVAVEPVAVEPVAVEPVAPDTIPMQPTGGAVVPLVGGLLAILGGLGIAFAIRRRQE